MWSRENVESFLVKHPVDTGGAINEHHISITEEDDGDVYFRVNIPFWWHNHVVARTVLNLAYAASCLPNTTTFTYYDKIVIHFFQSVCDPD